MVEQQAQQAQNSIASNIHDAYQRLQQAEQQLALYREGIIPQTQAAYGAALNAYQVGKVEYASVLSVLKASFLADLEEQRLVSDYLRNLAQLEAEAGMAAPPLPQAVDEGTAQ